MKTYYVYERIIEHNRPLNNSYNLLDGDNIYKSKNVIYEWNLKWIAEGVKALYQYVNKLLNDNYPSEYIAYTHKVVSSWNSFGDGTNEIEGLLLITDENKKILNYEKIVKNQKNKSDKKYWPYYINGIKHIPKGVKYRKDPIPGIHKGNRYIRIFRSFHKVNDDLTIAQKELKQDYPTCKIKVQRAKRNYKNMPNSYDDIPTSSMYNRNWKKYRKRQYKHKEPTTNEYKFAKEYVCEYPKFAT